MTSVLKDVLLRVVLLHVPTSSDSRDGWIDRWIRRVHHHNALVRGGVKNNNNPLRLLNI